MMQSIPKISSGDQFYGRFVIIDSAELERAPKTLRIRPEIFDVEPDLGQKLGQAEPKIPSTVPRDGQRMTPNDYGPISACFDDDPKRLNCELAQPSPNSAKKMRCLVTKLVGRRPSTARWWPFQKAKKHVFLKPARTPGTPKIGRKWGPRAPQVSSDCPRKSLDFEFGVGDRLDTLRVSRSERLFSI
jgi:hypothetical protein